MQDARRRWVMCAHSALLMCMVLVRTMHAHGQEAGCQSTATGDLRFHQLSSRVFGNTRTIRVWLPPGYDTPANAAKRYPVLYMLDGQNLFDACLSEVSHKEWQLDETMRRLIAAGDVPAMIVVGIDHAGAKRAHEYLPYKDHVSNPDMEEPAGKRFPDFLTSEVIPLVDREYRTLTGHANTGIGGSSYGGVASLYALMAKPNTFGFGLIESPTMWIGMGQLVRDTGPLVAWPVKVVIATGGKENANPDATRFMIDLIRTVERNFRAVGYDESTIRVTVDPEARHDEVAWAKRFPDAVKFLFADWPPERSGLH